MKESNKLNLGLANIWEVVCYDSNGAEKWREKRKNIVVTVGLNHVLGSTFDAVTQVTSWFVGLKASGTPVAADTMASHGSWTELVHTTKYSQTVRQTLTLGTASAGSIDNTASKATFSINATSTVAGAFVVSDNASSSATTGTLYGVVDFASSRAVLSGDTLEVTVTLTAASA